MDVPRARGSPLGLRRRVVTSAGLEAAEARVSSASGCFKPVPDGQEASAPRPVTAATAPPRGPSVTTHTWKHVSPAQSRPTRPEPALGPDATPQGSTAVSGAPCEMLDVSRPATTILLRLLPQRSDTAGTQHSTRDRHRRVRRSGRHEPGDPPDRPTPPNRGDEPWEGGGGSRGTERCARPPQGKRDTGRRRGPSPDDAATPDGSERGTRRKTACGRGLRHRLATRRSFPRPIARTHASLLPRGTLAPRRRTRRPHRAGR